MQATFNLSSETVAPPRQISSNEVMNSHTQMKPLRRLAATHTSILICVYYWFANPFNTTTSEDKRLDHILVTVIGPHVC